MTKSDAKKLDLKVAIITVSDRSARGEREDLSGPAARDCMSGVLSHHAVSFDLKIVPDDTGDLTDALNTFVQNGYDFILTTGGTGIGPRDITPEAIRDVMDKELPGIGEAMRSFSMGVTKNAMLSRALAGIAGRSLIVALPGSPKAVREILDYIGDALEHACHMVKGLDIH